MNRIREIGTVAGVVAMATWSAIPALGQCTDNGAGSFVNDHGSFTVDGGQVSLAGASLFVDFFSTPASTND